MGAVGTGRPIGRITNPRLFIQFMSNNLFTSVSVNHEKNDVVAVTVDEAGNIVKIDRKLCPEVGDTWVSEDIL